MMHYQRKYRYLARLLYAVAVLTICHPFAAAADLKAPIKSWPTATPEAQGMRSRLLAGMLEHVQNKCLHIDSILVVRNGRLVLDAYTWPFSKGQKHEIHSCTKSIMSALIGIAVEKGYIESLDRPVLDFFPEKTFADVSDLKKAMTLENLLTMASGLKCRDSYRYHWKGLIEMRYSLDWVQYVLDLPMSEPPGKKFEYCNGASHLLSAILQNVANTRTMAFAKNHLFDPLGIADIRWDTSPQGIDVGYGRMWLTPRDMAKFGWLYLNKGRWGKQQIVPAAWVEASTRGHVDATIFDQYGYQWWVSSRGYYAAVGYKGQRIFVVPRKNLVAVFTGDLIGRESLAAKKLLEQYILPAAESAVPLPAQPREQARLNDLVARLGKAPDGHVWLTESEGVARDGVFKRAALPGFTFEYPPSSRKSALENPNQIMRMKTPRDNYVVAYVSPIPEDVALLDVASAVFAQRLKEAGTDIEVVSNREITLPCGTKACQSKITWRLSSGMPITTWLVTAYKGGKCVILCAHAWRKRGEIEPIVNSLAFK